MRPIPEVDGLDIVFGGKAMQILPPYAEIPDSFKVACAASFDGKTHYTCPNKAVPATKWLTLVSDWFFSGIKNCQWKPKEGVDTKKALAAVKCCMSSFEPSHEHKEAGCAFLLSEWFEDVTYQKAK